MEINLEYFLGLLAPWKELLLLTTLVLAFLAEWIFKPSRNLFGWLTKFYKRKFLKEKNFIGIIQNIDRRNYWDEGIYKGEKRINIQLNWYISNAGKYNITVLNAYLTKPDRVNGLVLIKDTQENYWGKYGIQRGYTAEVDTHFTFDKELGDKKFLTVNVEFEDQFGQKYLIKNINVKRMEKNQPVEEDDIKKDLLSKIKNPRVRKILSVLKNEIEQYKNNGRGRGGLGTVRWAGPNTEYRSEGEIVKFLDVNSVKGSVNSRYAQAIVGQFKKASVYEKKEILNTLLLRLDKNSEYCNVAYLIMLVLFEIKKLPEGLEYARKRLYGDIKLGFSDMLRLLDLLLKFRYHEFTEKDLEAIEKLVESTSEHPFNIPHRINEIRINSLLQS